MSACNSIEEKLKNELNPSHLEIIDESYLHNVEPGRESHVRIVAVSEKTFMFCFVTSWCAIDEAFKS